jgi:peptidoglycan/xylan/chitin deacetylase (PgdA/CDA1 family)
VDLTDAEERADFERALASLDRLGVRPDGHRAAMWEASWRTAGLVAEYGLRYDSSLMDADRPYRLRAGERAIAELPPHWSLDDWEQYAYLPRPDVGSVIESPLKALEMWRAELDAMRRHGCLFMLTCHPFLSGRPSRVEGLRALIEHALDAGDVEFAAATTVAERALADEELPERELEPVSADPELYPD